MVDNVAITAGSGTTIAADDIGAGVLAQRVKPVWGPDGTGNDIDVVTGKPLPVQIRSATGLIPFGEPTDAKSTATDTTSVSATSIWKQISASLQTMAAWATGSGANGATVQRVALATDSPGVTAAGQTTKSASLPVTRASDDEPAHDAVDSGIGTKAVAKAIAGLSSATLVAAADRTDLYAGLDGALITRPHCGLEDLLSPVPVAITDGSSTSVMASAGAGVKNYVTTCIIVNTSATAVTVDLRDGAAGAVKATFPVPPNTSGVVCNFPVPLGFSAATAVCADPSAAASTITVTLIGFKSKV